MSADEIFYSNKYNDDKFEYRWVCRRVQSSVLAAELRSKQMHNTARPFRFRHVVLPKELARLAPQTRLMTETEWRSIGVQQSRGWIHYMIHTPEPHILLFRRPLPPTEAK